MKLIALKQAAV